MKKTCVACILCLVIMVSLTGCDLSNQNRNQSGSILIKFDLGSKVRSLLDDFTQVSTGKVLLLQAGVVKYQSDIVINSADQTGEAVITDVCVGSYDITIELYKATGDVIYSGTSKTIMQAGVNGPLTISLSKNSASLIIAGRWSEDITDLATATFQLQKGAEVKYAGNLILDQNRKTITGNYNALQPGAYELTVEMHNTAGILCGSGSQTVTLKKGTNNVSLILVAEKGLIIIRVEGDVNAPRILAGPAVSCNGDNVTISWTTDEAATSNVCYATTSGFDYLKTTNWAPVGQDLTADTTDHAASIQGLSEERMYYFVVVSADLEGNTIVSDEKSFIINKDYQLLTKLTASVRSTGDNFGAQVASAADGNTVLVGATGDDAQGADAGAVYIFRRNNALGTWAEKKIVAPDGLAGQRFGGLVALSADSNTALIGVNGNKPFQTSLSIAYIYKWNSTTLEWSHTKLSISTWEAGNFINNGVALSVNGDCALISITNQDDRTGAVLSYRWNSNTVQWEEKLLRSSFGAMFDVLDFTIALSGDGNTALLGTTWDDGAGLNAGGAYVYAWDAGTQTWGYNSKLTAADAADYDLFGRFLALTADGNKAFIGNPRKGISGAAYIFSRAGQTGPWQQTKVAPVDGVAGDQFGSAVSISATGNTALVGAANKAARQGAAYILSLNSATGDWVEKMLSVTDGAAGDLFGCSAALSADGRTAIIGASGDDSMGSVYIYKQ